MSISPLKNLNSWREIEYFFVLFNRDERKKTNYNEKLHLYICVTLRLVVRTLSVKTWVLLMLCLSLSFVYFWVKSVDRVINRIRKRELWFMNSVENVPFQWSANVFG